MHNMKTPHLALIAIFCMLSSSMIVLSLAQSKYSFQIGDFVDYKIKTHLNGNGGWYEDYSETERESRHYEISNIVGTEITWAFTDDYYWNSNEDPAERIRLDQIFKTDAETNEYLENTYEGPSENLDYYTFDYFWIRIDPNVLLNEHLTILGYDYQVTDLHANIMHQGKIVECIQVDTRNIQEMEVSNFEYDFDGLLEVTFTETYWYDVNTGYLIKSIWNADAFANHPNSYGSFHWKETVTLTDSSFTIPMSNFGIRLYSIIGAVLLIGIIIFVIWYRIRYINEANRVLRYLRNEISESDFITDKSWLKRTVNSFIPPFYSFEKSIQNVDILWDPLELPYQSLLVDKKEENKLGLKNGLFIVIDPHNRFGIIDLLNQRMVSPHIFSVKAQNVYLLLKIALSAQGTSDSDTIDVLMKEAYQADLQEINVENRTANEILLLCSSSRELKRYSKAFGWGRAYREFYSHLKSLNRWNIVKPKFSMHKKSIETIPLKLKDIAEYKSYFASPDELLQSEISEFSLDFKHLSRMKLKYNLWIDKSLKDEFRQVSHLLARRKVFDYTLGQAPLTPASYLKKLYHVMKFHPNRVLLIGDDDLLSVSLARNGIHVCVLEVDPYTCALIQGITDNERLSIEIHQVDLKKPLPTNISRDFDLFVADPDFTPLSFTLFLSRGLSMINEGGRGIINFEGKMYQRKIVNYLLNKLSLEIEEFHKSKWTYSSIHHKSRKVLDSMSHYHSGKYSHVDYSYHYVHEIVYGEAPYHSQLYVIRKTHRSILPIAAETELKVAKQNFYDY